MKILRWCDDWYDRLWQVRRKKDLKRSVLEAQRRNIKVVKRLYSNNNITRRFQHTWSYHSSWPFMTKDQTWDRYYLSKLNEFWLCLSLSFLYQLQKQMGWSNGSHVLSKCISCLTKYQEEKMAVATCLKAAQEKQQVQKIHYDQRTWIWHFCMCCRGSSPWKTLVLLGIDQIAKVLFHAYPSQGDLESEVEELGERSLEASKLVEPRENSYIEFRVCSQLYVEDSK